MAQAFGFFSTLEAMAIYVVKQTFDNDIMASVYVCSH